MSGEILLERDGDIATVTLSNPGKLNALGLGSWKRLGRSLRELDADKRLRCVVMRGAGDKAFAAGADIFEFETTRRKRRARKNTARCSRRRWARSRDAVTRSWR